MKKKPAATKQATAAKAQPGDFAVLITEIRNLIQSARRGVASAVDRFQVMTNFEIGRCIIGDAGFGVVLSAIILTA